MYIVTRLYFPDYTGQFCELNVNRCSMLSCFEGVNCSDNRGRSRATCGPCPTGLTGDGLQCTGIESHHCNYITLRFYIDVDECNSTKPCNQTCTNTVGSFLCACDGGYRLQENGLSCEGIV